MRNKKQNQKQLPNTYIFQKLKTKNKKRKHHKTDSKFSYPSIDKKNQNIIKWDKDISKIWTSHSMVYVTSENESELQKQDDSVNKMVMIIRIHPRRGKNHSHH